jgi:hypothetical protein
MADKKTENFSLFDPTKHPTNPEKVVQAVTISGNPDFAIYIGQIVQLPSIGFNIKLTHNFTSGKIALQNLIRWHLKYDGLRKQPSKGQLPKKDNERVEDFPIRFIFFDEATETDFTGTEFIQILYRIGFLKAHEIHFVLFLDSPTTIKFQRFATALGISFIYDINTTLKDLQEYFEVMRCTYIDPKIGCQVDDSICNKQKGVTYGPYFSIALTQNDGKRKAISLGLTLPSRDIDPVKDISIESNYYVQQQEQNKIIKYR